MIDRFGRTITVTTTDTEQVYSFDGVTVSFDIGVTDDFALSTINSMAPEGWVEPVDRSKLSCTPFQGRMALAAAGLLTQVEAAIAVADQKTKTAWEYALEWKRLSPMIETLIANLGITETQADDLFEAAQKIEV